MFGSFDRIGYARHRKRFDVRDLEVDLDGRRFLITGGNSGLGYATAEALARRGATVTIACRDAIRGAAARDALRLATGSGRIECDVLDLSDLDAVRSYAASRAWACLDGLIHNAGLLPDARALTRDGLELTFATHVVGPHVLTSLLRSRLEASDDARVVFVSSGGMYARRLDLTDLAWEARPYDGVAAYAQTKRMQVVLAERWAHSFEGSHVSVYAMHPGWADTPGVVKSLPRFHRLTRAVLRSPEEGADTIAWLACRHPAPTPSGGFFFDRKAVTRHLLPWTRERDEDAVALWATCEAFVEPRA